MKAVQLLAYGDVSQLVYTDVPTPEPKAGEILIKVLATSVNPVDWKIREGAMKERMPLQLPTILGRDVAGEVYKVGPGVSGFIIGQRVLGMAMATYADYVIAKPEELAEMPEGLTMEQGGSLPLILLTGGQLAIQGMEVAQGQTVLITGALGSVGRTALFVAKQKGATVLAGVRKNQKQEAAKLGAAGVVALDDATEIANLPQLDAIGDTVGGDTINPLLEKLKPKGILGSVLGAPPAAEGKDIKVNAFMAKPDATMLRDLAKAVTNGDLRIPIAKQFPLSQAAEAQTFAEKGGSGGKVVLIP